MLASQQRPFIYTGAEKLLICLKIKNRGVNLTFSIFNPNLGVLWGREFIINSQMRLQMHQIHIESEGIGYIGFYIRKTSFAAQ